MENIFRFFASLRMTGEVLQLIFDFVSALLGIYGKLDTALTFMI